MELPTLPFKLKRPLVWFDTETTGLSRDARICQVGLGYYEPGKESEPTAYWTLVNPGVPIPAGATAKHRIWDADVLLKPRFEEVAPLLVRFFNGADVGGYNVSFDLDVIMREFKRVGADTSGFLQKPMKIDGLRLYQLLSPRTLSDAAVQFLGRPHAGAHDAMADIKVTIEVVLAQLKLDAFEGKTLEEVNALCWPTDPNAIDVAGKLKWDNGVPVLTFGKYAHKPLSSVPRSYFDYLSKQDFAEETRQIFVRAAAGELPERNA
jgi:DNA polymerase III subunit epsilon